MEEGATKKEEAATKTENIANPGRDYLIGTCVAVLICGLAGLYPVKFTKRSLSYTHVAFGSVFVGLVGVGVYLQYKRVAMRRRIDWVVWTHVGLFAVLSYLGVLSVAKHSRKLAAGGTVGNLPIYGILFAIIIVLVSCAKTSGPIRLANDRLIVRYQGKEVDLTEFSKRHPGGDIIWEANGKDVETVWEEQGVPWHKGNPNVEAMLQQNIIM